MKTMTKVFQAAVVFTVWIATLVFPQQSLGQQAWSLQTEIAPIKDGIRTTLVGMCDLTPQSIVYQVGTFGLIQKRLSIGSEWVILNSGTTATLRDIFMLDQTMGWAVGDGVIVMTTNQGVTWTVTSFPGVNFQAIAGGLNSALVAVGSGGAVYRSTNFGTTWTQVNANTTTTLNDVVISGFEAIVVGNNGTICRSTDNGGTWTTSTNGSNHLYGVTVGPQGTFAVGGFGTILKYVSGQTWSTAASGTTQTLRDVLAFTGATIAVGANGTILKTTSGTSWTSATTGFTENLNTIIKSNDLIWAVGDRGSYVASIQNEPCQTPVARTSISDNNPVNLSACVGSSITFGAYDNGTIATRVWKKNGGPFNYVGSSPHVHPRIITLNNLQATDAGVYTMEVTSPCGTSTTASFTLSVNSAQQPSTIVGPGGVAQNVPTNFSVSPIAGATFNWNAGSGGTVIGSGNAVQLSWSTTGSKSVSVTATDACGTSIARSATVIVASCALPAQPSVISLTSGNQCSGSSATYSVTNVSGVNYTWTLNAGGTITSTGNNATVVWSTNGGPYTISVTPSSGCGNGTSRQLSVTVGAPPALPSIIGGSTTVCTNVSTPYSVTNVAGVTYTWSTGGGGTITGSGNAINVTWTSAGAKTLTVTPSTACGNGTPRTLAVTVNSAPSQPSVMAGSTTVATGSSNQFSVTNEAGVAYAWNAGTGGTVTGSGNSVTISWSSAGSKTITLTPSNSCGNGTTRTLNVTVGDCAVPSQPSTITGGVTACMGAGSTYSVTSVGGVSYAWNAGTDGSVVGTGNSVTLSWSSVGSKTVTVTPFNACGNGTPQTVIVMVGGSPIQPSAISGNTTACKDAATAYSVTNVAGVTYTWDTGGKGTVSGSGNSVNVTWTNIGNNTLVVTPSNACGNGPTRTLAVVVDKVPNPVGDITGNLSGCANTAIPYSVTNVSGVTYTWNGGAGSSASNTTNTPTITWNSAGSKTLTVTPSNACGNGTGANKIIDISSASAQPSVITGSVSATAGVAEVYSVTPVSGTTYTWNGGTNGTVIGVGNSVQISWSSAGTKTISVTPSNLCGAGTARTLDVTVGSAPCTAPAPPVSITGTTSTITGSTVAFTSALVAGATTYTFTVAPATGITIANTGNAHEKNITFAIAGTYVVSAAGVNACGATSAPATLTVQICTAPAAQPTGLSSTGVSCRNKVQRYSVNVVDGFTYEWGATNGTITNVANGIADVTWSNAATGQVYVRSVTPCGFSSTYIYGPSETLIATPTSPTITNDLVGSFCDGKVVTWTINNPEAGVAYSWVADRPATPSPTAITVTVSGVINIKLYGTNVCATNKELNQISGTPFPIPTTAPGPISGSLNPITGQITDYTIPNEGSSFGVRWDFGAGASDYPVGTTTFQALFGTPGSKTLTARYVSNVSCNVAGPATTLEVVAVNPCAIPNQPGSVSGLSEVCANTEYNFSVPFVADVDYTWTAGADATITGTLNNRSIKWTSGGSKTISVTASKVCGTSVARTFFVNVVAPPAQPAVLTGLASGCNGATQQISLASPVAGVTYTWEVQGGNVVTSGGQGQVADITWTSLGVNQVKLKPSNACGNGTPRTLDVTIGTVPDQPSLISGEGEVCSATTKTFSVTNTPGTTYAWNAGSGGTVTGSGNSVSISWSTVGSKTVTVTPSNSCGNGTARTLTVNVGGVPVQPAAISGLASPTLGNEEAYSVTSVAGVNYTWSLSDKGTLSASGNNASVFWNTSGSATLTVTPSNTCGNGTARTAAITINKISQTITFTLASPVLANQAITLASTSTSGLPITYTSSNNAVAEVFGSELVIKNSGAVNITASQTGDATFAAASPVVRALTINKANQTITFAALSAATFGSGDIGLEATSDSGLPVSYTSANTSVATVSGNTVTIVGAGIANITATQGGDAIFNAATPVVRALTVNKADQTISFESLVAKGISDPPFSLTAAASSGLSISYSSSNTAVATVSGNTVTIIGQGTTTITATQSGNVNYNAAVPVNQVLTVNGKQGQSIAFNSLVAKTFGDPTFTLNATASSSLTVSYSSSNSSVATVSGNTITIVGAGSTEITASQAGDAIFNPATSVQQTLVVDKANQTISFTELASRQLSEGSFEIVATSTSGLTLSFTSSNPGVASISGNQVTLIAEGTTEITALQSGNANFNAASNVVQTLTILNFVPTRIISMMSAMEFGSQVVPGTLSKNLTIENTGNSDLAIKSITFPDGYTGNKASGIIGSGESLVVEVTFAPTASKDYSGKVEVVSNATSGTGTVDVSGKGVLVTALEDTFGLSNIKVFPNPSEGVYTIQGGEVEARQARITDEFGRKVMIVDLQSIQSGQYQLDISDLSQGVYFLHLASKQPRVIRLVKVN